MKALGIGILIALALLLFFAQKDLGPALMLSVVFLAVYGIARGRIGLVLAGSALLAAGFYAGYWLGISATLAERVRMWQSPWDNAARGGNQIAHALWAMATGGPFGTGPGDGDTGYIPAGYTDLVLASVGEEMGFAGLLAVAGLYVAMVARALRTARQASTEYGFFLATILALLLAVPVVLMATARWGWSRSPAWSRRFSVTAGPRWSRTSPRSACSPRFDRIGRPRPICGVSPSRCGGSAGRSRSPPPRC